MTEGISLRSHAEATIWRADEQVVLEIDARIYAVDVALAAAYKFTDRAFVWLQSSAREGCYLAFLRPKLSTDDFANLSGAYANELIDQALRARLDEQFTPMRTLITAQAFSEANLLDSVAAQAESK